MAKRKTHIIGVAPGGAASLTAAAQRLVAGAEIVFGGQRLLDMFPGLTGEKIPIGKNLAEIAGRIKECQGRKRTVVLASGDPGFFGIAGYLSRALGRSAINIIPNLSAMQLAFARIGVSWDDAAFVSVHARPIGDIVARVRLSDKVGIFTDGEHTPAAIAAALLDGGVNGYRAYVCENLGGPDERITRASLKSLRRRSFSPLNTLILLREGGKPADTVARGAPAIPDAGFYRRRPRAGLITKQEIRAISLAKMQIAGGDTVWDIGAGSGAVAIEASRLASAGRVYAVEKNEADLAIIRKNIRKFRAGNVTLVHACAPDGLDGLPPPAAVFIGGSGGKMEEIIGYVARRLPAGGRAVINIVGLENLNTAVNALRKGGFQPEITLVNIARSTGVQELTRLAALNPVFVIAAGKGLIDA